MVTFETKVWEGDWRYLLQGSRLEKTIARCHYPFASKKLFINNVNEPDRVCRAAERLVSQKIISEYVVVDQHAQAALDFFELTKADLGQGYVYSIAELVSIYLCTTPFLLHFSSDSMPEPNHHHWVEAMTAVLAQYPDIAVANLMWNGRADEVAHERIRTIESFSISQGFSDQMYLIRTADFRKPIYRETNLGSAHYPKYGGELFEKRVHSWMLNHQKYRATLMSLSYRHQNFSSKPWVEKLRSLFY
jgi:hypothetical protein